MSRINWLRVLDTTALSQVHQRIRQQRHPRVPLLPRCKTPPPLERSCPRKGPLSTGSSSMEGLMAAPRAFSLRGLAVAWMLCDVGDHAGIEEGRPVGNTRHACTLWAMAMGNHLVSWE